MIVSSASARPTLARSTFELQSAEMVFGDTIIWSQNDGVKTTKVFLISLKSSVIKFIWYLLL